MPGRDPNAKDRSARVAAEIRTEMRRQGITGPELVARINKVRGNPVADNDRNARVWISRRLTGKTNLVQPERVVYGPTEDLTDIAKALGVDAYRLVRVVNTKPRKPAA
jgi:hypothetical protein